MSRLLKWTLVVIAAVAVLYGGLRLYGMYTTNSKVTAELRSNPEGERAGIVMLLSFQDGKQIPVNYLREGNTVFVGADGPWWRELRGTGAPVTLQIRGETLTGHAVVVLNNPDYVRDTFTRLRPAVPEWLPDWLNGKLVVINLDESKTTGASALQH
jgi:hypothetical protein